MKCGTCGAINGNTVRSCDFCQTALYGNGSAGSMTQVADSISSISEKPISFLQDALNFIGEINKTPAKGFNIWAFLFPVAYLTGYRADENAKKVATVLLAPGLVLSLVMYFSAALSDSLSVLINIWWLFVGYLIATRTYALSRQDIPYALTRGVGFQILLWVVYGIILAL
jgi:hypothetical protein